MPYNVTIDDISPLITYKGQWADAFNSTVDIFTGRYLGRTFHTTQVNGDQAFFQFNGTAVYVFGAKRGNHGNYTVQIDDEIPRQYDGFAPTQPDGTDGIYQAPICVRTNLANGLHRVTLTNNGQLNQPYFDIDFVTWTSNDEVYANKTYDDGQFNYAPPDAWGNTSVYVEDYYGRTEHLTNRGGASASIEFNGTGVYLYGGTLENHGAFTIELDDHPPVVLNGSTNGYHYQVPLYYADGLGPGSHKLTVTNTDNGKYLDIDYITVVQPPPTSTSPALSGRNNVPMIAGIVCGVIAMLALSASAIWYLLLRKKKRPESIDLIGEEIKPYGEAPPARHGSSGAGILRNNKQILRHDHPWTNNVTRDGTSTYSESTSTYTDDVAPMQSHGSSSIASIPQAQIHVSTQLLSPKRRATVIRTTGTRGERLDQELRATRMQVPGRAQDWGPLSDTSDNEATEMLPPDYHQVNFC
ncbi:hypothetical protein RhiJN_10748 [Ceratobasidium sp. AG-Ba]|nr:hypothetical protein RhiJN_10748 [Ceratobasidium sp. AG-Ba]QRW11476.1 hypothetical protein RhiLY_10475 [Ceratobasidium sp. AG-Ba]